MPRGLLALEGDIKRNLSSIEKVLEGMGYDSPSTIKDYIGKVNELMKVEQEIFDRIGLNRVIRLNRRS